MARERKADAQEADSPICSNGGRLSSCGGHDSAPRVSAGDEVLLCCVRGLQAKRAGGKETSVPHVPQKAPNPDAPSSSVEPSVPSCRPSTAYEVLYLQLLRVRAAWRGGLPGSKCSGDRQANRQVGRYS